MTLTPKSNLSATPTETQAELLYVQYQRGIDAHIDKMHELLGKFVNKENITEQERSDLKRITSILEEVYNSKNILDYTDSSIGAISMLEDEATHEQFHRVYSDAGMMQKFGILYKIYQANPNRITDMFYTLNFMGALTSYGILGTWNSASIGIALNVLLTGLTVHSILNNDISPKAQREVLRKKRLFTKS